MKTLLIFALFFCLGCDSNFKQVQNGQRFKVELYSEGQLVREWTTVGTVGRTSGVYHFADEATGETVYVTADQGSLVVTSAE